MTDHNYLVVDNNGTLSLVHSVEYMASDGSIKSHETEYEICGNIEGLSSGDILKEDSLNYVIKMVKYEAEGKKLSRAVMRLLSWEKVV